MHLAAMGELMQGLAVQNIHFLFRCNPKGTVLQHTQDGSLRKTSKTRLALSLQHATSSAVPCIAVHKEAFFLVHPTFLNVADVYDHQTTLSTCDTSMPILYNYFCT